MKAETEALLYQCRTALLQRNDEELDTLLKGWFECMIGEEHIEEELDDLCILLNYRVRSAGADLAYGTYTAWWEVEGCREPSEGAFECANVASLRKYILECSLQEFDLLIEVAYQALALTAEFECAGPLPTGNAFLYRFAEWLEDVTRKFKQVPQVSYNNNSNSNSNSKKKQKKQNSNVLASQKVQVVVSPATTNKVSATISGPGWMTIMTNLHHQEGKLTPLAETIVLPAQWADLLTKPQLCAFLTFLELPAGTRDLKPELIERLLKRIESDQIARAQFFEVFVTELAIPPWELEELLACTTTERKRWVEEERFPVLEYRNFHKGGSDHPYPIFDRRVILSLASEELEGWRAEHQARVQARRKAGAQAAAASRKANAAF